MSTLNVTTIQDSAAAFEHARLVQVVTSSYNTHTTTTTTVPADNTVPLITEGVELLTLAITPTNASNTLIIKWDVPIDTNSSTGRDSYTLFKDSGTCLAICIKEQPSSGYGSGLSMTHVIAAGSTSEQTFRIRFACNGSGTAEINGIGGAVYGGTSHAVLTIMEIRA